MNNLDYCFIIKCIIYFNFSVKIGIYFEEKQKLPESVFSEI